MEIISADLVKSRRQQLIEQMSSLDIGKGFYIPLNEVNCARNYAYTEINSKGEKEIKVATKFLPTDKKGKALVRRVK